MPKTKKNDPAELLQLALTGLDEQIAELHAIHTQLAAMIGRPSASLAVEAAAPQKRRKLSAEARGKNQRRRESALGQREEGESEGSKGKTGNRQG